MLHLLGADIKGAIQLLFGLRYWMIKSGPFLDWYRCLFGHFMNFTLIVLYNEKPRLVNP